MTTRSGTYGQHKTIGRCFASHWRVFAVCCESLPKWRSTPIRGSLHGICHVDFRCDIHLCATFQRHSLTGLVLLASCDYRQERAPHFTMRSHTSLSVARRLGSDKGLLSTNKLEAPSLRCAIVLCRSSASSSRAGSSSPPVAVPACAQSSRMRSSILRLGGCMNARRREFTSQRDRGAIPCAR
jgi:hypothetical protein